VSKQDSRYRQTPSKEEQYETIGVERLTPLNVAVMGCIVNGPGESQARQYRHLAARLRRNSGRARGRRRQEIPLPARPTVTARSEAKPHSGAHRRRAPGIPCSNRIAEQISVRVNLPYLFMGGDGYAFVNLGCSVFERSDGLISLTQRSRYLPSFASNSKLSPSLVLNR
jgi:hypothetical protein